MAIKPVAEMTLDEKLDSIKKGIRLFEFVHDKNWRVRFALVQRGFGLDSFIEDNNPDVRVAVAKQKHGLETLVYDPEWVVREAVAEQGFGLDVLVNDPVADVRIMVARQNYGLKQLIYDDDPGVKRIARLFYTREYGDLPEDNALSNTGEDTSQKDDEDSEPLSSDLETITFKDDSKDFAALDAPKTNDDFPLEDIPQSLDVAHTSYPSDMTDIEAVENVQRNELNDVDNQSVVEPVNIETVMLQDEEGQKNSDLCEDNVTDASINSNDNPDSSIDGTVEAVADPCIIKIKVPDRLAQSFLKHDVEDNVPSVHINKVRTELNDSTRSDVVDTLAISSYENLFSDDVNVDIREINELEQSLYDCLGLSEDDVSEILNELEPDEETQRVVVHPLIQDVIAELRADFVSLHCDYLALSDDLCEATKKQRKVLKTVIITLRQMQADQQNVSNALKKQIQLLIEAIEKMKTSDALGLESAVHMIRNKSDENLNLDVTIEEQSKTGKHQNRGIYSLIKDIAFWILVSSSICNCALLYFWLFVR